MTQFSTTAGINLPIKDSLDFGSHVRNAEHELAPARDAAEAAVDALMHPNGAIMHCFKAYTGGRPRYDSLGLVRAVPASLRAQGYYGLVQPHAMRSSLPGLNVDVVHGAGDPRMLSVADHGPRMRNGEIQMVEPPTQSGGLEIGRSFDVGHCHFHPVARHSPFRSSEVPDVWRIESSLAPNLVDSPVSCLSLAITHEHFFSTFLKGLSTPITSSSLPVQARPRFSHSSSVDSKSDHGPLVEFKQLESTIFWRIARHLKASLSPRLAERFLSRPLVNVLPDGCCNSTVGESLVSNWINEPVRVLSDIQGQMKSNRSADLMELVNWVSTQLAELQQAVLRCDVAAADRGAIGRQYVIGQLRDTVCQAIGLHSAAEQAEFELLCKVKRQLVHPELVSFDTGDDVGHLVKLTRQTMAPVEKTNVAFMADLLKTTIRRLNARKELQFEFDSLE
ncbi:MAG TPA: hypothetical protein VGE55_10165 [Limnobacter sp.]|uniref:hypothetical protein n=1 Tax=Limnobacter sp. TaxID=2003368 RepID=UPI002ED8647C